MKKSILLLSALIFASVGANAADWAELDNGISNVQMSIDKDSIYFVNDYTCLYAMKIKKGSEPEKAVFIKSDFQNNKLGIVTTVDYEEATYNPKAIYINAPAFLKPVDSDSIFAYGHRYTSSVYDERVASSGTDNTVYKKVNNKSKFVPVNYMYADSDPQTFDEYVKVMSERFNKNWNPPKSGRNTQTIIIVSTTQDGSLMGYEIAQSSGDELTDRSVISAVETSVPFCSFPKNSKRSDNINVQFVFDYQKYKKSVK